MNIEEERKRYKPLENVLNTINQKCVALPESDVKRNNQILPRILESLIQVMKQKDPLFKALYQKFFCGGSYYDGLKVSNPDEYDIDILFNIPSSMGPTVQKTDQPGFVQVKIEKYHTLSIDSPIKDIKKFMEHENFLSTDSVARWFESVIQHSINGLMKSSGLPYIEVKADKDYMVYFKVIKAFPAFTLQLYVNKLDSDAISVDLVPCFQFNNDRWPCSHAGYRPNPIGSVTTFFVVPKKPKKPVPNLIRYWRLSFQEQEKKLITGNHLKALKPSLKLLKKLRDKHNHKIASYFIKTIFLWELQEQSTELKFWTMPLGFVFMHMLKKYAECIKKKEILYYWNDRFNLIGEMEAETAFGIANNLKNIIKDIERGLNENTPLTVAKYLLTPPELQSFQKDFPALASPSSPSPSLASLTVDFRNMRLPSNSQPPSTPVFKNPSNGPNDQENALGAIMTILKLLENKIDKVQDKLANIEHQQNQIMTRLTLLENSQDNNGAKLHHFQ